MNSISTTPNEQIIFECQKQVLNEALSFSGGLSRNAVVLEDKGERWWIRITVPDSSVLSLTARRGQAGAYHLYSSLISYQT